MINKKSLLNLQRTRLKRAKPGCKRCNFTLKPETVERLKKYPNKSSAIDKMVAYVDKHNINLDDENPHPKPLIFFNDSTVRTAALERQVATLEMEVELLREKLDGYNYEE